MTYFPNSQNVNIYGSTLTDVQGDFIDSGGGSISIHRADPLLQILYPATSTAAAYDSQERYPPPRCQPGTRQAILEEITTWIESGIGMAGNGSIMWLHGPAGAGKSAIAQTVCETSAGRGLLAASFFFSRGNGPRGKIDGFIATIAFQLAMSGNDLLRSLITQAVQENPLTVHTVLAAQAQNLIIRPLRSSFSGAWSYLPYLIVIDGVDECSSKDHQSQLLITLLDLVRVHSLSLYILIVSRPEPHIKHVFSNSDVRVDWCRTLSLYGDHQAYLDVCSFLREGFNRIHDAERHSAIMQTIPKPWPANWIIPYIAEKSGGYFIYASTVLKFVDEEFFSPIERLSDVVGRYSGSSTGAFAELDKLYAQILMTCPTRHLLKRILGCIFIPVDNARRGRRLSFADIALQLGIQHAEVALALRGLHSLLSVRGQSANQSVKPFHASLGDFLFHKERAGLFYIDAQEHHQDVAITCWNSFSGTPEDSDMHFILDSFHSHWTRIPYKSRVLDGLKGANSSTWAPFIQVSQGWNIGDKLNLSTTVHAVIVGLETLDPQPTDVIDAIWSIASSIYMTHLYLSPPHPPPSPDDIRLIQGISTMFIDQTHPMEGYEDFLGIPQTLERAHIVKYLTFVAERERSTWPIPSSFADSPVPICKRPSFSEFMSDPRRCGDLFATPEIRHGHISLCCFKDKIRAESCLRRDYSQKTRRSSWDYQKNEMGYAQRFFDEHLSRAPQSTEREIVADLRDWISRQSSQVDSVVEKI